MSRLAFCLNLERRPTKNAHSIVHHNSSLLRLLIGVVIRSASPPCSYTYFSGSKLNKTSQPMCSQHGIPVVLMWFQYRGGNDAPSSSTSDLWCVGVWSYLSLARLVRHEVATNSECTLQSNIEFVVLDNLAYRPPPTYPVIW